jgi:hypothetical protein
MSLDTFPVPLVPLLPFTPVPINDNTREGVLPAVALPNLATTPNGSHQRSKITVNVAQNCLRPAHFLTAFLFAAVKTKPPDDANRSIGQTYCVGTARDGPQQLQTSSPATSLLLHHWHCHAIH